MTRQLGLKIFPKLRYAPGDFILHAGVEQLVQDLFDTLKSRSHQSLYPLVSVLGEPRSGKTHLSLFIAENLRSSSSPVQLVSGEEFGKFLSGTPGCERGAGVYLVDDSDRYLSQINAGESGALVKFIEELRNGEGIVIFFRRLALSDYTFDSHLVSRFRTGLEFQIGDPARDDLVPILRAICVQRGVRFSHRKVQYLEKRLGVSIADIENYFERVWTLARVRGDKFTFPLLGDAL